MNLENARYATSSDASPLDYELAPTYVANAFTKTENKVNLVVDNANITCLTSKNNKFSLDEDGNLVVNSITSNTSTGGSAINLLDVYPIGSIYMSVNDINPSTLFGGTWEAWGSGRCLIGVDTTQKEFDTVEKVGGEKEHTLISEEMPKHTHTISTSGAHTHTFQGYLQTAVSSSTTYLSISNKRYASDKTGVPASMNSSGGHTHTPANTGEDKAHNNLQPYITCYMWKRVA